jgi:inosine-uridine nucleoside N-ribohydrolase
LWLPGLAALAAVAQPRLFERETHAVDVELEGQLTRGMTIADRRLTSQWKRNTDILTHVDSRAVLDLVERLLRTPASE